MRKIVLMCLCLFLNTAIADKLSFCEEIMNASSIYCGGFDYWPELNSLINKSSFSKTPSIILRPREPTVLSNQLDMDILLSNLDSTNNSANGQVTNNQFSEFERTRHSRLVHERNGRTWSSHNQFGQFLCGALLQLDASELTWLLTRFVLFK